MDVHEAQFKGSDPQTAMAIAKQCSGPELPQNPRKPVRLGSALDEPSDATAGADQERAVFVFTQTLDAVQLGQRVEFGRTRFPSPHPVEHAYPEIALAVLIQSGDEVARTGVLTVAVDRVLPNRAELP